MKEIPAYAPVLVKLLKGPLYAEATEAWALLFRHRPQVEDWFFDIGLEVVIAEHDGLAFVRRSKEEAEREKGDGLPELVARRELPYRLSLLCVLLVDELYRFEASSSDENRLVLGKAGIRELLLPYLPKQSNEARQADEIDRLIAKLEAYGFARKLSEKSEEYEITKLLKHKIGAEELAESLEKLKGYAQNSIDKKDGEDE